MTTHAAELRVSTLELFFDLVFVFTITQLTASIEHNLTVVGVIKALAIFVVTYWMYSGYAWLTNQVPPNTNPRRLFLIGGMVSFFACALAIPGAFDRNAFPFAVGYVLVVVVHSVMYARVHGAGVWRFVPFNVAGAVFLFIAAFTGETARYVLWAATILLQGVTSMLATRVPENASTGYKVHAGHFVERHGLLLIVAFGESVVAIGIPLGKLGLTPSVHGAAVFGLVLVAALWWIFFNADPQRAENALSEAPVNRRVRLALYGFFFSFILVMFGIVTLSAGLGHAVTAITHALPVKYALLLGGGAALYLLGLFAFRLAFGITPTRVRLMAVAGAVASVSIGAGLSALAQVVVLLVIAIAVTVAESVTGTRSSAT